VKIEFNRRYEELQVNRPTCRSSSQLVRPGHVVFLKLNWHRHTNKTAAELQRSSLLPRRSLPAPSQLPLLLFALLSAVFRRVPTSSPELRALLSASPPAPRPRCWNAAICSAFLGYRHTDSRANASPGCRAACPQERSPTWDWFKLVSHNMLNLTRVSWHTLRTTACWQPHRLYIYIYIYILFIYIYIYICIIYKYIYNIYIIYILYIYFNYQ